MGILKAENTITVSSNNNCRIYIIKQEAYENRSRFQNDYASILGDTNKKKSFFSFDNSMVQKDRTVKLVPLLMFDEPPTSLYTSFDISDAVDRPRLKMEGYEWTPDKFYFLTSLLELRNCPLLDFSKLAYVFQIDGQSTSGLANVISFTTNFSVNGQSAADIVINNKDFKYNFKYFSDREKYPLHLKSFFDVNDIVIIRYQKKNTTPDNLINSFIPRSIDYWKDPYASSETDPFTTIFTGYINNINDSFSFANGQQTVSLTCTGPSKKLAWTRFLSNKAANSKDSQDAILPLSAFINTQTNNEKNKTSINNDMVVKNAIVRTYSGVLNIPEVKEAYKKFTINFDKLNNIRTDENIQDLKRKLKGETDTSKIEQYNKQLNQNKSALKKACADARATYNDTILSNMNEFVVEDEESGKISIKKHTFIKDPKFGTTPYLFEIEGTSQPAYQWTFNNWSSLFKSDFSTVYQFIKGVADYLQFNFYDDPYGTIHFGVPNLTLLHLQNPNDPNNLNQLVSFAESQDTENIANIQYCEAQWTYNLSLDVINTIIKDYKSIDKYGERMMQPFQKVGITDPSALRYAARMMMAKYNRKALSNIKVSMYGEPSLKLDEYAYIKSLRKLFYVESYSHSYQAGDKLNTTLSGTYTREILCLVDIEQPKSKTKKLNIKEQVQEQLTPKTIEDDQLTKQLKNCTDASSIISILRKLNYPDPDVLSQKIYQIYVDNFGYPADDENLKFDIGAMYNADNLSQCILDGFFWALPFDADPYAMAKQILKDEKDKKQQLRRTFYAKQAAKSENDLMGAKDILSSISGLPSHSASGPLYVLKNAQGLTQYMKKDELVKSVNKAFGRNDKVENFDFNRYSRILEAKKIKLNIIYEPQNIITAREKA